MRTKFLALLLFFICGLVEVGLSERIYILYDPSCMDQLEYQQLSPDNRSTFLSYHINIGVGEKLIFETGRIGQNEQNYLPPNYLSCGSGGLDQELVNRVNSNVDEVFILIPQRTSYLVQPVSLAGYYQKQQNLITYSSPKYQFRLDITSAEIGQNITFDNPGVTVYFEGWENNGCSGAYLFNQLAPRSAYPVLDFKLVPEIGITEERVGTNNQLNSGTTLLLTAVNGDRPEVYLANHCGQEPGLNQPLGVGRPFASSNSSSLSISSTTPGTVTPNTNGLLPQPTNRNQPNNFSQNQGRIVAPQGTFQERTAPQITTVGPTNQINPAGTGNRAAINGAGSGNRAATNGAGSGNDVTTVHEVAKGETLYGISRRYSVTVGQIQEWNNLGSTVIMVGDRLRVAPPGAGNGSGDVLAGRGPIATANPGAGQIVPYDQQQQASNNPNPNERIHIVKPGETVPLLALQYGYTETRFRNINDLGPNDFIKVGQRLRTSDCQCPEIGLQNQPAGNVVRPQEFNLPQPNPQRQQPGIIRNPQTTTTSRTGLIPSGSPMIVGQPPATSTLPQPSNFSTPTAPATNPAPATGNNGFRITNEPQFGSVAPNNYDNTSPRGNAGSIYPNNSNTTTRGGQPFGTPTTNQPVLPYRGNSTNQNRTYNYNNSAYDPRGLPTSEPSGGLDVSSRGTPINSYDARSYSDLPGRKRRVHIVEEGETMLSIAREYRMTADKLAELNDIRPGETIMVHQVLFLD